MTVKLRSHDGSRSDSKKSEASIAESKRSDPARYFWRCEILCSKGRKVLKLMIRGVWFWDPFVKDPVVFGVY